VIWRLTGVNDCAAPLLEKVEFRTLVAAGLDSTYLIVHNLVEKKMYV
jgi:hypothetical protein